MLLGVKPHVFDTFFSVVICQTNMETKRQQSPSMEEQKRSLLRLTRSANYSKYKIWTAEDLLRIKHSILIFFYLHDARSWAHLRVSWAIWRFWFLSCSGNLENSTRQGSCRLPSSLTCIHKKLSFFMLQEDSKHMTRYYLFLHFLWEEEK